MIDTEISYLLRPMTRLLKDLGHAMQIHYGIIDYGVLLLWSYVTRERQQGRDGEGDDERETMRETMEETMKVMM